MATTFEWVIYSPCEVISKEGSLTDVLIKVKWERVATSIIEDKKYTATYTSNATFPAPDSENFTPFNELTFEQVCGWVASLVKLDEIDLELQQNIDNQLIPKPVDLPLPWKPTTTTTTTTEAPITTTTTTTTETTIV
jgi:hypothetical protein